MKTYSVLAFCVAAFFVGFRQVEAQQGPVSTAGLATVWKSIRPILQKINEINGSDCRPITAQLFRIADSLTQSNDTKQIPAFLGPILCEILRNPNVSARVTQTLRVLVPLVDAIVRNGATNIDYGKILQSVLPLLKPILVQMSNGNNALSGLIRNILPMITRGKPLDLSKVMSQIQVALKSLANNTVGQLLLKVSPSCRNNILYFGQALQTGTMWAISMLDATGKLPSGVMGGTMKMMGSYQQCMGIHGQAKLLNILQTKIDGEYCNTAVSLTSAISLPILKQVPALWGFAKDARLKIYWDLCVPRDCSGSDLSNLMMGLFNIATDVKSVNDMILVEASCATERKTEFSGDKLAVATTVILGIFAILIMFCTLIDGFGFMEKTDSKPMSNGHVNEISEDKEDVTVRNYAVTIPDDVQLTERNGHVMSINNGDVSKSNGFPSQILTPHKEPEQGTGLKVVKAYSLYNNVPKVLGTKAAPGSLTCLNGIRVLSMCWIILGHTAWALGSRPIPPILSNMVAVAGKTTQVSFEPIINGTFSVDVFFLISGLLVTYLLLKQLKKSGLNKRLMGLFYFHRFWRLTPLYAMVILIYSAYYKLFTGPLTPNALHEGEYCRKYWWANLVYLNNFKLGGNGDTMRCIPWTWYLANDMQMYIISPIFILSIFYLPIVGTLLVLAAIAVHIITTGVLFWNLDGYLDYMLNIYMKPWCRIAPYAIGIGLGYILYHTKCKLRMPKPLVFVLWLLSIGTCFIITYVTYTNGKDGYDKWTKEGNTAYNALNRPVWSVAIAWMVLACCTGHGGVINRILSWSAWLPLTRLTYGAYLVHIILMDVYYTTNHTLIYYSDYTLVYFFLGHLMLAYGAAFVLTLAFESPMMTLEKILFKK